MDLAKDFRKAYEWFKYDLKRQTCFEDHLCVEIAYQIKNKYKNIQWLTNIKDRAIGKVGFRLPTNLIQTYWDEVQPFTTMSKEEGQLNLLMKVRNRFHQYPDFKELKLLSVDYNRVHYDYGTCMGLFSLAIVLPCISPCIVDDALKTKKYPEYDFTFEIELELDPDVDIPAEGVPVPVPSGLKAILDEKTT